MRSYHCFVRQTFLLLSFFQLNAQNDTLFFRHFNVDHGLSNRNVSSIIQDSLGFMWYGTREGLNEFDGYRFIPFKHDPTNKNSLVSDDVTCLAVEKSGVFWIGTEMKGMNCYNPYTNKFELFQHDPKNKNSISDDNVNCLNVDTIHDCLWIGTNKGLNAYDFATKEFSVYKNNPTLSGSISSDKISSVSIDKNGIIWIGTASGLNSFDIKTKKFISYLNDPDNKKSLSNNHIHCVFSDKQNKIWVATSDGLDVMEERNGQFQIFHHDEKNKYSISSNNITSVFQDKYGKIWIGTEHDGLDVYYPTTGRFFVYSHEKEVPNSLSSNEINTISQGRSGMFWAATRDGGLNAFNPKTLNFNLSNPLLEDDNENVYGKINCFLIDGNKNMIIGTEGNGLYVYDQANGSLKNFRETKSVTDGIICDSVQCIYQDSEGRIFLGTENGLEELNPLIGKFQKIDFLKYQGKEKQIGSLKISSIYRDHSGVLWIGTNDDGLFSFDETKKITTHFEYVDNKPGELSCNDITCILEGENNVLWIGTFGGGLNRFDERTKSFAIFNNEDGTKHRIGGNYINKMCLDRNGTIWVTTSGGGLNALRKGASDFTCYTVHDGLPDNSMNSIMVDDSLNLWIGTDLGICRLTFHNAKLFQSRMFDLIDGLPTTEFYESASCRKTNGGMVFSCKYGFVNFFPDSLHNNQYKPPVVITAFLLTNKPILPGDSTGILKTSISVTPELDLKYAQNSFSFEFTAISFINAGKNKYAYMLEGFDMDWNYRSAQNRIATYTNIPPGTYVFHVKASNNDGIWNDVGTSLVIVIAAPFWKTWWFYSFCGLFVILVCYSIYFFRMKQILHMQEVRNKISKDLHDEIGSSLSSISIYSEVAKKITRKDSPEAESVLNNIGESARTSMENMSDIVWAVNPKNDRFKDILDRFNVFANQLMGAKNIVLHLITKENVDDLKLPMQHRKNIYLLLKEATNNVAKYSHAKNFYVTVEKNHSRMSIQIKDDGVGFESNPESLGGNGLINMKQRVDDLKGEFQIQSGKGKGTTLTIKFNL